MHLNLERTNTMHRNLERTNTMHLKLERNTRMGHLQKISLRCLTQLYKTHQHYASLFGTHHHYAFQFGTHQHIKLTTPSKILDITQLNII